MVYSESQVEGALLVELKKKFGCGCVSQIQSTYCSAVTEAGEFQSI